MTSAGVKWLTVPVLTKGHTEKRLADMQVNPADSRWRRRCWRTIEDSYRNHPYFDAFGPELEAIYAREWLSLVELNTRLIDLFMGWLRLDVSTVRASELAPEGTSSALLLDICRKVGATEYLAGPGSAGYLDEVSFDAAGIRVKHARYEQPPYPQRGREEFVGNLSVLDMVFNVGGDAATVIRSGAITD